MHHELPVPLTSNGARWYRNAGLLIRSEVPLDELATPAPPGEFDLEIRRISSGAIATAAARAVHAKTVGTVDAPWVEVFRCEAGYLLRWPGQLDVLIPDGGREILVHEAGELEDSAARLLLCHALSFVMHEHGKESIHASAVEIDGAAVIISGDSGMGKSTLATALALSGGRLLADDVAVIGRDVAGDPVLEPSSTRTWLLHDVARQFSLNGHGNGSKRLNKRIVGGDGMRIASTAAPVRRILILAYEPGESISRAVLTGNKAMVAILGSLFNRIVRSPERLRTQFALATELAAGAIVEVLRWEPSPRQARIVAEQIAADMKNGAGTEALNRQRRRLLERLREAGLDGVSPERLEEPLLQTSEVAALLRASDRTIRTWADAGKLPYIKTLGGRRMFPAAGVISALNAMNGSRVREEHE